MSRFARHLGIALATAGLAGAFLAAPAAADSTSRVVVDDDHAQCPDAEFETIQKAVNHAAKKNSDVNVQNNVDVVRVCPGIYEEQVSVDTSVTITGVDETVSAVDCFSPTRPIVDPATQAVVVAPAGATASAPAVLFDLQADKIELDGFVLLGQAGSSSRAVVTSSRHSGYKVHHNLIMLNTVGAYFRSTDTNPIASAFEYNCLRENGWGVANQFLPLHNARIHHNSTFRTNFFTYEQTRNCPEFLETGSTATCSGSPIGMKNVVFDHNVSVGDSNNGVYRFAFSMSTTAYENVVTATPFGMRLLGANEDLHILDNRLEVLTGGLVRQSTPPVPSNFGVLIQGNTITRTAAASSTVNSAGIGMGTGGLKNSQILDNVISGFTAGSALSGGILFNPDNTGNLVAGNTVTNSGTGIGLVAGATGNTIEANTMFGNGLDARDDTGLDSTTVQNTWKNNSCVTSSPNGLCPTP